MDTDNPNEGLGWRMNAITLGLSSIATLFGLNNNKPAEPVAAIPPKPIVQNVPGLPVETTGMKINYTPLPSPTVTSAAVADANVQ